MRAIPPTLRSKLAILPTSPGVYQFIGAEGETIYVGKAKSLRHRVSSYFTLATYASAKTRLLVARAVDLHYTIVDTESDALLLENNLIKRLRPRYNVLLKDDKTYPWICIRNERFPRVITTRRVVHDGSRYFGPYTSGVMMKTILELIRQLFPIRTCGHSLTQESIDQGRFKLCLEYDLGNCLGPCAGLQGPSDYDLNMEAIAQILKGHIADVEAHLRDRMARHAQRLEFEQAHALKLKLEMVARYQAKTTIVSPTLGSLDVFSIVNHPAFACVNYLKVRRGAVQQTLNLELRKGIDEPEGDLLAMAITELRSRFDSDAPEIIVPARPDFLLTGCRYTVPARGDKFKLLELSLRNCRAFAQDRLLRYSDNEFKTKGSRQLAALMSDFRTPQLPRHIECFDNSNLQGTNPVAACVVFRNAKPSRREYRHFNISTVDGPDDFASMHEVVTRRYTRRLAEGLDIPQLIVVDGGKGQLNIAYKAICDMQIDHKVQVIGIAKRLEEIFLPHDPVPLHLDKTSESLKVIQHMRNEAHRFSLAHHRDRRSRGALSSALNAIPGIGSRSIELLMSNFGSLEAIAKADLEALAAAIGQSRAQRVLDYFASPPPQGAG